MAINLRPGCKGVIFAGLIPVGASWGQPVEPEVLEDLNARRFVLRDGRRQVMAQLAPSYNGGELELRDAKGEIAAVVGDGLRLRDREGQVRANLRLGDDDAPLLEFYDERGALRAGYSLSEGGAGSLAFYDEAGGSRAGLGSGQTGRCD